MEIIRINHNSWRIEDGFVRFFLLTGEKEALLVDTGASAPDARRIAETLTDLPLRLLNTHSDGDHTAGNGAFDTVMMSPAEWAHRPGTQTLQPVADGDVIDLGGRQLLVIDLPGHTPGSIALLDRETGVLISGDSVQDGHIFMFGKGRDIIAYRLSLGFLWQRFGGLVREVWPCHGSFPVSPNLIPKLLDAAKQIEEDTAEGRPEEMFGSKILTYDFGFAGFFCDYDAEYHNLSGRVIRLGSVKNLRTLGGLSGKDGTVRDGILLRSAALNTISEADAKVLKEQYNLKLVIDLRTDEEAAKKPDLPIEGVEYLHLPVCATEIPGVSKEAVPGQQGSPDMLPDLNDMYINMVTRPDCVPNWGKILKTILRHRDGSVLWHCTAGKDRCGLTAMFLLLMLGVDEEAIVEDYLITNHSSHKTGRRYFWEISLFLHNQPYAEKVRATYEAKREFLASARRAIDEQFGTMDNYLNHLGLTRQEIEDFRAYALQ